MIADSCIKLLLRQDCKLKSIRWSILKLLLFISIVIFIAGLLLSIGVSEAIGMEIESDSIITESQSDRIIQFESVGVSTVVNIPDEDLEMAIRNELGKLTGDLTVADMESFNHLYVSLSGIEDLTGLEYATSLEMLYIENSRVEDLSPLSGLVSLNTLSLRGNRISCLEPLSSLSGLKNLTLSSNVISELEPLAGLAQLEKLLLYGNKISDLEPLSGLYNLNFLLLGGNQVSDLGPLAGLTGLDHLQFEHNQVKSLEPLSNLTELDYLMATQNQISDIKPLTGLSRIRILDLSYNKISDVGTLVHVLNERLTHVGIAYNYIDITPGSEDMDIITYLRNAGVVVLYEPQFETPLPGFDASLSGLSISPGNLSPAFDQDIFSYIVNVEHNVESVNITATLSDDNAILTINSEAVSSGETKEITLNAAGTETMIDVVVTAGDGDTEKTYTLKVNRGTKSPATPSLTLPVHGEIVQGSSVEMEWDPAEGATHYAVWIYNLTRDEPVLFRVVGEGTSFTYDGLVDNGDIYAWSVVANNIDDGAWGDFAIPIVFIDGSDKDLLPPTLISPEHYENVAGTSVDLEWEAPAGATHYSVWVYNLTTDEEVIFSAPITETSYHHGGLANNGDIYAWSVVASNINDLSWSDFAFPRLFINE